jgi:cell fate regulator YaaT (PSP1 superfamily)
MPEYNNRSSEPETRSAAAEAAPPRAGEGGTQSVVSVRLRKYGNTDYYTFDIPDIKLGDWVIVGQERGLDCGKVITKENIDNIQLQEYQRVVRVCTPEDLEIMKKNHEDALAQVAFCQGAANALKLNMKVINAEYVYDRTKIIFYFAAPERVDFRQLVRDLARELRIRIELHQVGIRDEMRITGCIGSCGREACCVNWIHEFMPVNIRMAKLQQIQLHPAKLSGVCGRLKCCLAFEQRNYRDLEQQMPHRGQIVRTENGTGEVIDNSLLAQTVTVKMEDGSVATLPSGDVTVVSRTKSRAKVRVQKRRRREDEEMMSDKEYEQDLLEKIAEMEEEDE